MPTLLHQRCISVLQLKTANLGLRSDITYFHDGTYSQDTLDSISILLRDPDIQEAHDMPIETIGLLYTIKESVRTITSDEEPIVHIISGFRSKETNQDLIKNSQWKDSVAKDSQHIEGTAIDFYIPGVTDEQLRDIAWCLQKGGVGFYPDIADETGLDYIHIDTGRIRFWGGSYNFHEIDCQQPAP